MESILAGDSLMLIVMNTGPALFGSEWPESCNTEARQDAHLVSSTVSHPTHDEGRIECDPGEQGTETGIN